jgi:hypothetical protein
MQCNAKAKSTGQQCRRRAVSGSTKCTVHGGLTPKGAASPHFKTGRYSKYLPVRLVEVYHDSLNDSALTGVRDEIALIDSLLIEDIQSLDLGSNGEFWEAALEQIRFARQGYKAENYGILERALDELEALGDQRRLHFAAERELREKIEQRRKLVETEAKINLQGERAISAVELLVFMGAVVDTINRKIPDVTQRNELLDSIDKIMGSNKKSLQ